MMVGVIHNTRKYGCILHSQLLEYDIHGIHEAVFSMNSGAASVLCER